MNPALPEKIRLEKNGGHKLFGVLSKLKLKKGRAG